MKRVGIFRAELLPRSETFIRDQACALSSWQPILLGRRELVDGLSTPGIRREIVPATRSRVASALRFWLALPEPQMVARLRALELDLVHVHFGTDATELWPNVKAAGLPMLVTLHGYDINTDRTWWEAGHGGRRRRIYPHRLLALARSPGVHFVAVSGAVQRRAVEYGLPADKVSVAHIGVDTRRFRPGGKPLAQRRRRILFVGRMVEKKAPLIMVQAFAQLREQVPDAELVMIGDGPLLPAAKALAAELAVPITFAGACDSDEVLFHLQEARVFCLPSVTARNGDAEGFGLVILEAQASGVPVVTSARGGAEEGVVDGRTGIVCREGVVEDLVRGLSTLLQDELALARSSAEAAQFAASVFDLQRLTRNLERIYAQMSDGSRTQYEAKSRTDAGGGT